MILQPLKKPCRVLWIGFVALGLVLGDLAAVSLHAQEEDLIGRIGPPQDTAQTDDAKRPSLPEFLPRLSKAEQYLTRTLEQKTEVSFRDNDLESALNYLEDLHHIEIWMDPVSLKELSDPKVTLTITEIPLRSCLNLMLEPLGLTHIVEDEVVKVMGKFAASQKRITRTYLAGDLLNSAQQSAELSKLLMTGLGLDRDPDATPALVVSPQLRTIVLRDSHQSHDQLLQLLRNLREANTTAIDPEVVLSVGYERDLAGNKKSDIAMILYGNRYSEVRDAGWLKDIRQELEAKHGKDAIRNTTLLIRAEKNLPMKVMQQLFTNCKTAGFEKISIDKTVE